MHISSVPLTSALANFDLFASVLHETIFHLLGFLLFDRPVIGKLAAESMCLSACKIVISPVVFVHNKKYIKLLSTSMLFY